MLYCKCGYSCGIPAALERHLAKFASTAEAKEHAAIKQSLLPCRRMLSSPDLGNLLDDDLPSSERPRRVSEAQTTKHVHTSTSPSFMLGEQGGAFSGLGSSAARVILVRHGQSANKRRDPGSPAAADPDLTDLGFEQAEAVAERLYKDFRSLDPSQVTFASSPMRRCLYTIQPTVRRLRPPTQRTLCYGGGYEFGCGGLSKPGSSPEEIARDFPEFTAVGFNSRNNWDYRGDSAKETEEECQARGLRIVHWLLEVAAEGKKGHSASAVPKPHTVVLSTHQTIHDLLCTILLKGSPTKWRYGELNYKLRNAGITELLIDDSGRCIMGAQNDGTHLLHLTQK